MLHNHSQFPILGELAAHVDRQHQHEELDADEFHWHLMLPRDFDGDGHQSDDDLPLDVVVEAKLLVSDSSNACQSGFETRSMLLGFASSLSANPNRRWQDVSSRLSSDVRPAVRMCAVLCVMQV